MSTQSDNEYMESCIKSAISEIANLSNANLQLLLTTAKNYYTDILSEISVMTKIAYFAMDNYANINADTLSSLIENEKLTFTKSSFNNNSVAAIQSIIKAFTSSLANFQSEIEKAYNLDPNTLSIFDQNSIEANINFKSVELVSPVAFKYYEGKVTLNSTSKLINIYTDLRDIYNNNKKSLSTLTTDKASDTLSYFISVLKQLMQNLNDIKFIIDSANLANYAYKKFLLINDKYYGSFLDRNYDTIRNDMVTCYSEITLI